MTTSIDVSNSNERADKRAYATALLREPDEAYSAAFAVAKGDPERAMHIFSTWHSDAEVQALKDELIEEFGELHFVPTKAQLARAVYSMSKVKGVSNSDKLTAYKLYAELMGYIEKPSINNTNINAIVNQNRVMIVESQGTDAEWETKAADQQRRLIESAHGGL